MGRTSPPPPPPSAGLLVPPRDPRALAEAVCRVARDRDLAHELSSSAHARAAAEFGLQPMVDRIEAVHARALERRVAPAGPRRPQPEPAGSAAVP